MPAKAFVLAFASGVALAGRAWPSPVPANTPATEPGFVRCVTNISEFRALSPAEYLSGCDFRLTGVITLADSNRNLIVLQDSTGAVALHSRTSAQKLPFGESVTLAAANCCPLFVGFPDFPNCPSGRGICKSFEASTNRGEYSLTRMRGYLQPPVTGEYTFWIASQYSSELWLSTNADPANIRKIASVPRYCWTEPRQWNLLPTQRSDRVQLKGGESYYIEALQEHTIAADHLAVAWEGPAPGITNISVIDGRYLAPWSEALNAAGREGILREYWTNYFAGNLEGMAGPRPYESALSVENISVTTHGAGRLPAPERIAFDQPLAIETKYRWVLAKGRPKFKAAEGQVAVLDIVDGPALTQVRVLHLGEEALKKVKLSTNVMLQVEGVCEGVLNQQRQLMPGRIWASAPDRISIVEYGPTNELSSAEFQTAPASAGRDPLAGYFGTRGVVTFNDRVWDKEYTIIQQNDSVWLLSLTNSEARRQLQVGDYIDLGGAIDAGQYLQTITPTVFTKLGAHAMPPPIAPLSAPPVPAAQEGRWSELEGVVRAVSTNDTLSLLDNSGLAWLWVGQTPSNALAHWVDAKVRVRGVLLQHVLDAPLLLIPSLDFVDLEESPPGDPFGIPRTPVANLLSENKARSWFHRVRVVGEVTYRDAESFFVQDDSGGIRVETSNRPSVRVGDAVQVVAFPGTGSRRVLTEPLVRATYSAAPLDPRNLDLGDPLSSRQAGTLVQVNALLLARKSSGGIQVLELQDQQRIFSATLASEHGNLPDLTPGSRLLITGVRGDESMLAALPAETFRGARFSAPLNLLLRQPQDVVVISGPPWWTWKRTTTLVGVLLAILAVVLLWAHLLRRRLEHQQAAGLAFSQHVLGKLEQERQRIAGNLHDSLGHTLLVIKNHAQLATHSTSGEAEIQSRMNQISSITSQAIEEVRRIAQGLRPSQLDRLGLTETIRASVNRASENSPISFASRVESIDGLFEGDAEIHVYRIVQEAITNVVKHSAATEATVVVKKLGNAISLSVRDNGRGFDPAKLSSQTNDVGYGITGIAERVRILKGTLALDSRPDAGTRLTAEVPFQK